MSEAKILSNGSDKSLLRQLKLPPHKIGTHNKCIVFICDECGYKIDKLLNHSIGWSETNYGVVTAFECPKCFHVFHCHYEPDYLLDTVKFLRTNIHFKIEKERQAKA